MSALRVRRRRGLDQFLSLVEGLPHLCVDDAVRLRDEAGDESLMVCRSA